MPARAIDTLETRAPFSTLFPIDPQVLSAITDVMRDQGFDPSKPIDLWGDLVVDGHTRLAAAVAVGLPAVPVYRHDFADEDAALEYAIHNQRDRRNMTDADIFRCVQVLDRRRERGGDRGNQYTGGKASAEALPGKSAAETAAVLGTSRAKVERARTVLDHGDTDTQQAVTNGQLTLNGAYRETQARRQYAADATPAQSSQRVAPTVYSVHAWTALAEGERARLVREGVALGHSSFNREKTSRIEWALWTWNPVTGCDHGCNYCYARDIANHWFTHLPAGQRFAPVFYPDRLSAPRLMRVPPAAAQNVGEQNVFVCSMADLFGKWVPQDWIDAVFAEVARAPEWNFLFLTKFPQRLAELHWPDNAWVGTTVDTQARVATAQRSFAGVQAGVKWLSCEPLLERLTFDSLAMFDWIVIGSSQKSTQTGEFQPPWEWVEHLMRQARAAGCQVYIKPELTARPREYPTGPRCVVGAAR